MSNPESLTKPVKTGSVSKLVLERIKEALINKELGPGDYLPSETELAKNLGVGKSSVREAVKMLEAMGVVEVKQGNGTIICDHTDRNSVNSLIFQLILENGSEKDVLDLRMMFETSYTVMAMKNVNTEDIRKIEATIDIFEANIKAGKQEVDDDLNFHYAILESTHNPFVIIIGDTILQLFKTSIYKSVHQMPDVALADHKRIFNAFCVKDEKQVTDAIASSLEVWKNNLK